MKYVTPYQYAKMYGIKHQAVYKRINEKRIITTDIPLPDGTIQKYIDIDQYPPEKYFRKYKK